MKMLEWESRRFQNKNTFFLAHQHDRVSLALKDKFVNTFFSIVNLDKAWKCSIRNYGSDMNVLVQNVQNTSFRAN